MELPLNVALHGTPLTFMEQERRTQALLPSHPAAFFHAPVRATNVRIPLFHVSDNRPWGREKNGTEYPFFYSPNFSFLRRSKTFPTVPFGKIQSPHSPTEKWDIFPLSDTCRHSG